MKKFTVRDLAEIGVLAALVFVATYFLKIGIEYIASVVGRIHPVIYYAFGCGIIKAADYAFA